MEDVVGRLATLDDVDAMRDICREGFPGSLLWDGPGFLARGWWRDVLRSSSAETWVWSSGHEIAGVCVLVKDMKVWTAEPLYSERSFYVRLFAAIACPRLVLSRFLKKMRIVQSPASDCPTSEAISINSEHSIWIRLVAVARHKQRQGVGRKILQFCERRALELNRKVLECFVFSDNKASRGCCLQQGYVCKEHRHNGCVYMKALTN